MNPLIKAQLLDYVRLKCENPKCSLYYLAHPDEPVFVCFTCQQDLRNKTLRQTRRSGFHNPIRVYNRYDRPFVIYQSIQES